MNERWKIGIIGGSGLYALDSLEDAQWIDVDTPWGAPSDQLLTGRVHGVECVFLPRHGRGHCIAPDQLNMRANVDALKRCGVTDILAISAVGSLQERHAPGDFVVVDQFIDWTKGRRSSFFGNGLVAHVSMADPVCPRLLQMAARAAAIAGFAAHPGGTYLAMEGPQFSTRAESRLYRQWGADVIGMTAMPEARLAREAELPYALVGMVTDYDCWRENLAPVEVSAVLDVMHENARKARLLVENFLTELPERREPSPIDGTLDFALVTAQDSRDPAILAQLDAICGRLIG